MGAGHRDRAINSNPYWRTAIQHDRTQFRIGAGGRECHVAAILCKREQGGEGEQQEWEQAHDDLTG